MEVEAAEGTLSITRLGRGERGKGCGEEGTGADRRVGHQTHPILGARGTALSSSQGFVAPGEAPGLGLPRVALSGDLGS